MAEHNIIPTHDLATWLLGTIDHLLDLIGLEHHHSLEQIIYFITIVATAYIIGWAIKKVILLSSQKAVRLKNSPAGRALLEQHTLTRCSHFIPPLVFLSLAPFAFDNKSELLSIIIRISAGYLCCTIAIGIIAIISYIFSRYNDKENTRNLPIKGILNVACGLVWIITVIVAVSIIVQKSPTALLGGMTAFAAVLMLVFKDSILGLVAGIQMSQNDMLHVGDWIVVPSTPANGIVEDVSLTTVKVRNFDETLIMVPPYTLVSTSFQNYRGMQESGVRRISQNIYVYADTIKPTTPELLASVTAKYPLLKDFVDSMQAKKQMIAWNPGNAPRNGTLETNVGLFRAYVVGYLLASDMISHDHDLMVLMSPMSPLGLPLQIYCFAVTTQWQSFEGVMSAVMEHIISVAPDFGLSILSGDGISVRTANS